MMYHPRMARSFTRGFYILEFVSVLLVFLPILLGVVDLYHLFRTRSAVWETAHKMADIYKRVGYYPNTPGAPVSRYDNTIASGYNELTGALPYALLNCPTPSDKYCLNFVVTPITNNISVSVQYQLPVMVIGYVFGRNVVSITATSTRRLEESFLADTTPWIEHH